MANSPHLFCFGLGFSARVFAEDRLSIGWTVSGTCQGADKQRDLQAAGITAHLFDQRRPLPEAAFAGVTHVLVSVPPDADGDPVLDAHADDLAAMPGLEWLGYLSTTGVYGDTGGKMVDETAPTRPDVERSRRRALAEAAWLDLQRAHDVPVQVFRLAGIYGPGRSLLDTVRAGRAKRVDKPGHVFSRIHVEDIARVLAASIARPRPGAVYNLCDDAPAPPAEVTEFACGLLGVEVPPLIPFAEAEKAMSAMARSFWADNRRVDNGLIKRELGVALKYPDYQSGLRAILAAGG